MELPSLRPAIALLEKSQNILLLTHRKLDGDGLSSSIVLSLILKKLGKNVTAVCPEPVPEVLKFLPSTEIMHTSFGGMKDFIVSIRSQGLTREQVRYTIEEDKVNIFISPKNGNITHKDVRLSQGYHRYDLVIVVDTPDYESLGELYEQNVDLFYRLPVVNIDHHVNNTYFGKINLVDIMAASTTEILAHLLPHLAPRENLINEDIATLLLAGIITDTGSFQNPNTTPQAFATAAKLVEKGARQQEIIKNIYKTKKLSTLKLWGQVLSNVKTNPIYRLVWSTLSEKEYTQQTAGEDDMISIIDTLLSNAPGAEIILLLVEEAPQKTKAYIKTVTPSIDAGKIAGLFQGKGSYHEASFEVPYALGYSEHFILEKLAGQQSKRLGISLSNQSSVLEQTVSVPREETPSIIPSVGNVPIISTRELEQTISASLPKEVNEKKKNTRE